MAKLIDLLDPMASLTTLLDETRKRGANVHPVLLTRTLHLVHLAASEGYYFAAFMGLRTVDEQNALFAQGRRALTEVNSLRLRAGMTPISAEENQRQVTKARGGDSFHNYGLAFDLVEDGDPQKAGVQWSWKNNAVYLELGKFAQSVGLEWGGFWKAFKDYPHVQLTGGLKLAEAKRLYNLGGIPKVWQAVDDLLKKAT